MKFKELQKKSKEDLKKEVDTAMFDLLRLRAQARTGSVGKDAGKIRKIKRHLARIKTLETQGGNNEAR